MVSVATKSHGGIAAAQLVQSVRTGVYIAGCWREATEGSHMDVADPATGEILTSVASGTVADATAAVDAASHALPAFANTAPRERAEMLRRAFTLMTDRLDAIARLIVLENGKTLTDARAEAEYATEFLRWYSEEAVRNFGQVSTSPSGANRILVLSQPIGVAALVTPWNFPAAMLTRKIGPAIAAGCTVVCKPASETPLTALLIAQILEEAGIPPGVVNVVCSNHSAEFVRALLTDPRVRKLSFTGSTEVGSELLKIAADNVINCSMELGGNAPFIVFDDSDVEEAIGGAMVAKMRNGGEACTAANRFYVQRGVADSFSRGLAQAMGALKVGPGLEDGIQLGPLVNRKGRDKVAELVETALEQGAEPLVGAVTPKGRGWFYPPTVLNRVAPESEILRTEIFGPVAPIVVFDAESEAIEMANDSECGLVSYVYSGDLARGLRVSEALESGMVGLNRGLVSDPAAPFGGVKQSGLGREGGHEGLLEFLEKKYISVSW